jgi:hypothetical protein
MTGNTESIENDMNSKGYEKDQLFPATLNKCRETPPTH